MFFEGPAIRQENRDLQCLEDEDGLDASPLNGEIAKIVTTFPVNRESQFMRNAVVVPVEKASVAEGAN